MTIRLSQVRSLCTDSELALVQASRRPELNRLTTARLKQHAQRARKLFDKWQDQSRSQARERRREAGFSDEQSRAELKARIFQEALQKFEERLAKLEAPGGTASPAAAKPKKVRAREHREARANVRAHLAEKEDELNRQARSSAPAAAPSTSTPEQASLRPAEPPAARE